MSDEKDLDGRPYARVDNTKVGDILVADGGFTCIREGAEVEVYDDRGSLWVPCARGEHHLSGQLDAFDTFIGLYHKDPTP